MRRFRFAALVIATVFVAMPALASAATIQTGKLVALPAGTVAPENVYLAGEQVSFSTTAQKDLVAAAEEVTVNGPVWGDALLAGGRVQVLQPVRGDVRAAGGEVTIGNDVNGDLIVLGGTVTVLPGATVGGDVIAAGGTVDIEGAVKGSVRAYGQSVTINGAVRGPVIIHAARKVSFGSSAVLDSTLWYAAPQTAALASGANVGSEVTFVPVSSTGFLVRLAGIFGLLALGKFIAFLVLALVFVLAWRRAADALVAETFGSFWKFVGIGLVTLIVGPVLAAILAFTLIGFYFALMVGILSMLLLLAAGAYMCVVTGALLALWIRNRTSTDWRWTAFGTVVVFLIAFVPVVGWIADVVLFLAALGALVSRLGYAVLAARG